jgi:hypothetical protein
MRRQFIDLDRDLGSLNLNSLAIEVMVVIVEFGTAAHRGVEIVGWNVLPCHDCFGDGIAHRNSFQGGDGDSRVFHYNSVWLRPVDTVR